MEKQTVVVIGGSSGVGLATAKLVAARGARVVIVGRDQAKLTAAAGEIGASAKSEAADAQDRGALDALFNRIGRFAHLVLAATGGHGGVFSDLPGDAVRSGFEAKFWAQWNAAQAALEFLEPNGSISFVTAASSRIANPGTSGWRLSTVPLSAWSRPSRESSRRFGSTRCRRA